jgi:rare lipoprotein A
MQGPRPISCIGSRVSYFLEVSVMQFRSLWRGLILGGCAWFASATVAFGQTGGADSKAVKVSYYSDRYNGRRTANGQHFSNGALTAAHRSLPFGTKVKLTNVRNNRSVVVRINDRGPFVKGREISVTRLAARRLGFVRAGTANVTMEVLGAGR